MQSTFQHDRRRTSKQGVIVRAPTQHTPGNPALLTAVASARPTRTLSTQQRAHVRSTAQINSLHLKMNGSGLHRWAPRVTPVLLPRMMPVSVAQETPPKTQGMETQSKR
jgi:hypothetical protein